MNRVRLLPENVANQIAAGEVVERPASVVKELVENALDAGSGSIRVDIQAGGRSLIRVSDDGCGMSRDDALLCLERHATSKISSAADLARVSTMGFRGEALPSIASVSRFMLTTREKDGSSPEGTQIIIGGGKILEVKAAGAAPGTTIEVRQLFFNVPARRKFLRSEDTESAHIQHYLMLAALSHPQVGFTFYKDTRLIWQLPPIDAPAETDGRIAALGQRLKALHGTEPKLLSVNFSAMMNRAGASEEDAEPGRTSVRIWGLIGAPGVSRATRDEQHLFVNRRPVDNRGLNYALLEGYHNSLMKGRYPVCCIFLEIDPALVDVNIHPAKREVKFHREFDVRRIAAEAVRNALVAFHAPASSPALPREFSSTPNLAPQSRSQFSTPAPVLKIAPQGPALTPGAVPHAEVESHAPTGPQVLPGFPEGLRPPEQLATTSHQQPMLNMGFSSQGESRAQHASGPVPLLEVPLRLIGVVGRLYVLLESDRGLVLLDQHAAHERILYEQMLSRLESAERAPSQKLLLPQTVELPPRDAAFLRQNIEVLVRLGVGLSEFGDRTFLLDALPPFVKTTDARQFVMGLVDEMKAAGQSVNILRLGEDVVAKTVCRHAVKANDPLAGPELEKLIANLRRCTMPYTCPHGRPTLIEMNFRDLEKKFGRVQ